MVDNTVNKIVTKITAINNVINFQRLILNVFGDLCMSSCFAMVLCSDFDPILSLLSDQNR